MGNIPGGINFVVWVLILFIYIQYLLSKYNLICINCAKSLVKGGKCKAKNNCRNMRSQNLGRNLKPDNRRGGSLE